MNIQKYGRALLETSAEGSTTKHLEQDLKRSERYMKSSVFNTVETLGTETSLIRTVAFYGQFLMSRQNSHIFSLTC